jgi:hypothetical protein
LEMFLLWLFWREGLIFCSCWPGPRSFYFTSHGSSEDRYSPPCPGFSIEIKVSQPLFFFCPDWPGTTILQVSPSHVARMTGAHHHSQLLVEMKSH